MTVFVSVKTGCIIWNHFGSFFTSNPEVLARSTFFLQLFLMLLYLFLNFSIEISRSACLPSRMSFRLFPKKCCPKTQCEILSFEEPQKLLCLKTFLNPLSQEYGKSLIHCQLKCYRKDLFLNVFSFEFFS